MLQFATLRRCAFLQTSCLAAVSSLFFALPLCSAANELDTLPPPPFPTAPSAPIAPETPPVQPPIAVTPPIATPTSPRVTVIVPSAPPQTKPPVQTLNPPMGTSLQTLARALKLPLPLPQSHVVIWKAQRRLELWSGTTLVKAYRVALGAQPNGGKAQRGDGRTPEGTYYICTRNDRTTSFHRFMGLSYPALPDAKKGLAAHRINWREYQLITRPLASRGRPAWETNLGGWVGIHGGSDAQFATKVKGERGTPDWTAGCIGLTNRESEELFAATRMGTPVVIKP